MSGTTRASVLLSGGIDSAACAHLLLRKQIEVNAIFFDYGQAAALREQFAARSIANHLGVDFQTIQLKTPTSFGPGELVGRNAFFIFAALLATGGVHGLISLGLHSGTPYYDCSTDFVREMNQLLAHHTDGKTAVFAPFLDWTKKDVYDYFLQSTVPLELTYSCEAGTMPVCGKCASCRDRGSL